MEGTPLLSLLKRFYFLHHYGKGSIKKLAAFVLKRNKRERRKSQKEIFCCLKTEIEVRNLPVRSIGFAATKKWHRAVRLRWVDRRLPWQSRGHRRRRRDRW